MRVTCLFAAVCFTSLVASAGEITIPLDFEREVVLVPRAAALAAIQWKQAQLEEYCRVELAMQPAQRRDPGKIIFGDRYLNAKRPMPLSDLAEVRVQPITFIRESELKRLAVLLASDANALRDVAKLGGRAKEIVPLLMPHIEKAQQYTHAQRFCMALAMLGPHAAEAIPTLTEKVRNSRDFDRTWYCEALAAIGEPAVASLVDLMRQQPDDFGRRAAASGLAKSGKAGRTALRAALTDPNADVRAAAVAELPNDADLESRRLIVTLLSDPAASVRRAAAGKVSLCPPAMKEDAVASLLRMLDESDEDSQRAALYGLGNLHSQPQTVLPRVKAFLKLRGEASVLSRSAAFSAVQNYGPDAAPLAPEVIACLDSGANENEMAESLAALEAIGGKPAGAGIARVIALTTNKDWRVADTATSALFTMSDEAAPHARHLVMLLDAQNGGSRQHRAAEALVAMGPSAKVALPKWVPWLVSAGSMAYVPQETVRWMAAIDLDAAVIVIKDDQRRANRGNGHRLQDQREGSLKMLDQLRTHAADLTDRAARKEAWRPMIVFRRLLQRDWPRVVRKGDSMVRVVALLGTPDKVGGGKLIYNPSPQNDWPKDTFQRPPRRVVLSGGQGKVAGVLVEVVEQNTGGKVEGKEAAIEAFHPQVRSILAGYFGRLGRPTRDDLLNLLASDDKLRVQRQPIAEAQRRVQGTLSKPEQSVLILHGTLVDLEGGGECWAVESSGGSKDSICGYLDQATGKLLFVWIIPEG